MSIYLGGIELSSTALGDTELAGLYLGDIEIWTPGGGLPAEYEQVEYLQCTGTQYIDTGLWFDGNWIYEVDCMIDNESGNQMFGMKYWYNHAVFVDSGRYYAKGDRYDTADGLDTGISAGTRSVIKFSYPDKSCYIATENDSWSHTFSLMSPTSSSYHVVLGACWSYWSGSLGDYGRGRIYEFKWWVNSRTKDNLLAHMMPCIRKSDNKPGMYDLVRQQFFTNAGTGEFEYALLYTLPNAYEEVECLRSNGTQYIDLDFNLSGYRNLSADIRFYISEIVNDSWACASMNTFYSYLRGAGMVNGELYTSGGNARYMPNILQTYTMIHTTWTLDTGIQEVYMFARCNNNGEVGNYFSGAIYECTFRDRNNSNLVVAQLVPCIRKSDSKPGMYDVVRNVFFTNAGTGEFILGPESAML